MNTEKLLDELMAKPKTGTVNIPISKLHPFEGHPYKVKDDDEMNALIESIQKAIMQIIEADYRRRQRNRDDGAR